MGGLPYHFPSREKLLGALAKRRIENSQVDFARAAVITLDTASTTLSSMEDRPYSELHQSC